MLLAAGGAITNDIPLHYAAGVCSSNTKPDEGMSLKFDQTRIPIMALLVSHGIDPDQSGELSLVKHHPVMYAVMGNVVEWVKSLWAHGRNWGSAAEPIATIGRVLE